jgi:hypothetical protein
MKLQGSRFNHSVIASIAVLLFSVTSPIAWSQVADITHVHVRLIQVNGSRVGDFEELMTQRSAAESKAGILFNHVYERQRGQTNGFLIVSPGGGTNEPEVDLPEDWGQKINEVIVSHTVMTMEVGPSTIALDSPHPSEEYNYVRVRNVMPGKADEYADWQENKLIPALRDLDVGDVRSLRVLLGGDPNTFVRHSFVADWPDFAAADGDNADFAAIIAEENAMLTGSQNLFYRFRDELSFTAAPE